MNKRALGFTLVELLFVMAIFSGIIGALLLTFVVGRNSYLSSDAYIQVQQEARRAFDTMVKELREAGGTVTATAGPPSQLQFQIALGFNLAGCAVNAVCWGALNQNGSNQPGWSVRYRVSGTQVIREVLDQNSTVQPGTRVLANNVNNGVGADGQAATQFSYDGTNRVVTIRLDMAQPPGPVPKNVGAVQDAFRPRLSTQIKLRNTG